MAVLEAAKVGAVKIAKQGSVCRGRGGTGINPVTEMKLKGG